LFSESKPATASYCYSIRWGVEGWYSEYQLSALQLGFNWVSTVGFNHWGSTSQ